MAAPSNKSAKKLSSLFSLGSTREDASSVVSHSSTSSHLRRPSQDWASPGPSPGSNGTLPKSVSNPNFAGHMKNPSIASHWQMPPPISTAPFPPLAPPPALVNYGAPGPASSHGSVRSRPSSQAGSREGSRSRPSTPNTMAPPSSTSSPMSRTQMTPKDSKISKRQSWLPKRQGQEAEDLKDHEPKAWIAGLREHIPYDMSPIFRGDKVSCLALLLVVIELTLDTGTRIVERESQYIGISFPSKIRMGPLFQGYFIVVLRFEKPDTHISPEQPI
jgi:hypothetical protein